MSDRPQTAENELPVRVGQVLEGKFRVERIVGEGAMGHVVEATNLGLDERVALKFLRREAMDQPDIVARFAREARSAVKLKSDHVARVFDVGTAEDGVPFIVMEFLEGSDLATLLEVRQRLEISEAVEYLIQACEGLTEAHARGIVHRDIKPENLFLSQGAGALKQIKLLDFGISKAALGVSGLEGDLEHTTKIMGSPHYMSPDQIRSTRDVDGRADIWSLGIVLFELLTGTMPFTATDVTALIAQILHDPHQRLRALRPDAPEELEAIIDKCLSKDPNARFQSPADLAIALLPFAPKRARAIAEKAADIARSSGGSRTINAFDSIPPPSSLASTAPRLDIPPSTTTATQSVEPRKKRSPFLLVLLALLLLGIGAAAALGLKGGTTTTTAPAATGSVAAPSTKPEPSGAASTAVGGGAPGSDVVPDAASSAAASVTPPADVKTPSRPAVVRPPTVQKPTAAPATAKPSSTPSTKSTDSDIRLER